MKMKITALVVSVQNKTVSVSPIQKAGCASCKAECSQKSKAFVTANPFNFQVKAGDLVLIENSRKTQALQGIISLFFPIASAASGFFFAPKIAGLFGRQCGDGFRALSVLVFLILASLLVYISSRTFLPPERPQIFSVLHQGDFTSFPCGEDK